MNISRFPNLFAPTARRVQASTSLVPPPAFVHGEDLPPVLQRYIQRHLNASQPTSEAVAIPNPFLTNMRGYRAPPPPASVESQSGESSSMSRGYQPAYISQRRQKLLAQHFSSNVLPPALQSDAPRPAIRWVDPTLGQRTITWSGKLPTGEKIGLYTNRKRMFKGHKREINRPLRVQEIADRMEKMPERVKEWRKLKSLTMRTKRPSLPF